MVSATASRRQISRRNSAIHSLPLISCWAYPGHAESVAVPAASYPPSCISYTWGRVQLCAILESRQSLRKCGVYFVIREMDKSEPDAEISQVGHGRNRAVSNHVLQSLAWSQRRRAFESPSTRADAGTDGRSAPDRSQSGCLLGAQEYGNVSDLASLGAVHRRPGFRRRGRGVFI